MTVTIEREKPIDQPIKSFAAYSASDGRGFGAGKGIQVERRFSRFHPGISFTAASGYALTCDEAIEFAENIVEFAKQIKNEAR